MSHSYTLCWDCGHSTDKKCSWAKHFTPVEGWNADQTKNGYLVKECPLFDRDSYDNGLKRLHEKENDNE